MAARKDEAKIFESWYEELVKHATNLNINEILWEYRWIR